MCVSDGKNVCRVPTIAVPNQGSGRGVQRCGQVGEPTGGSGLFARLEAERHVSTLTGPVRLEVAAPDRVGAHSAAPAQGCSPHVIRRLALDDALVVCLAVLDEEPALYERVAATWHARWCTFLPKLTLADALVALKALEALPGPRGGDGARALRELSARHGLEEVAEVLDDWLLGGTGRTARRHDPAAR